MSVTRAVNMGFVAAGILMAFIAVEFYAFVFELIGSNLNQGLIGVGFKLSDLLGILTGIASGIVLYRHERIYTLAHEIGNELSKVTWPSWPETRVSTVVVVIVTIICALILGLYDAIWSSLTGLVYSI